MNGLIGKLKWAIVLSTEIAESLEHIIENKKSTDVEAMDQLLLDVNVLINFLRSAKLVEAVTECQKRNTSAACHFQEAYRKVMPK
jgi:hypothetical protein